MPWYLPDYFVLGCCEMKDHEIRELINKLRDIAIKYHATQQLRQQIAYVALDALKPEKNDEADTTYEVWQDDEWQAGSNSKEETMRYAMQYAEDGAVEVHEITRRVICKIEK